MLQIITGRFFTGDGKVNEQESDAILYSNYSWIAPIETKVAELRPVSPYRSRSTGYVLRYTNRYQPNSPRDPLVYAIADEAVDQFRLLTSFFLKSFFHVDRTHVEHLCRTTPSHSADSTVPNNFVPRFFTPAKVGTYVEVTAFVQFVEKALSIPRKQYRLLISCLAAFFDALEAIGNNFDLAYSIVVYMLEALSKSVEPPPVTWDDYDQNIRVRLDRELSSVEASIADKVKSALLTNPHLKLKKRFIEFISSHINDAYFTSEAEGILPALAKSELARALSNLYDARSGYVHELKQVHEQLRLHWFGANSDVFHWMNEPHLTFAGLLRLAYHVLSSFIARQPTIDREEYDAWREELPGQTRVEMAPQYWVWPAESFRSADARRRYGGFLSLVVANISKTGVGPLDLRKLMERIEVLAPTARPDERIAMLALYSLFNQMIAEKDRRPGWSDFVSRWNAELDKCSMEVMVPHVLFGDQIPWPVNECVVAFEDYQKSRYKDAGLNLPRIAEIACMAEIGNMFLDAGQVDTFDVWVERALLDAAGSKEVQELLRECRASRMRIDIGKLLGRPKPATTEREPETNP